MAHGETPVASGRKYITVVALCPVQQAPDGIRINRKFHTGMLEYIRRLQLPLACVLPEVSADQTVDIDAIEIPRDELPYALHTVSGASPTDADLRTLSAVADESALVYCGTYTGLNLEIARICRERSIPYVAISEWSRRTELEIMRAETPGLARRLLRSARMFWRYPRKLELLRSAAEVHANGYAAFLESQRFGLPRILFFDSRITAGDLIGEAAIESRLEGLRTGTRGVRLLYSGRYHPIKGTLDLVYAALDLRRRWEDFRLDFYGDGPLKPEMLRVIQQHGAGDYICIHDPVPFSPDLLEIARGSDVFLCAHKQGDPSCTYLETFGCGVPIVGYANEAWTPLCEASGGGLVVHGNPQAMAEGVVHLLSDYYSLADCSRKARQFAADHVMEKMWDLRCDRLKALLEGGASQLREIAAFSSPGRGASL